MNLKHILLIILFAVSSMLTYVYFFVGVPDIEVTVSGPAESRWGNTVTYIVTVTNNGNRDLVDVNVDDSTGFSWAGSLKVGESETLQISYMIPVKDEVVNLIEASGYTGGGELVKDHDSWTIAIPTSTYSLIDAVDRGFIDAEFRGTGRCSGDSVELDITPNLNLTLRVEITAGLILINLGSGQNMVTAAAKNVTVKPGVELNYVIEAYCLDLHKDNPSIDEVFSVQADLGPYSLDVLRLIKSLEDAPYDRKSVPAIQIALWAVLGDPTRSEVERVYGVTESSLEEAEWLLKNIGVNPSQKRLFT